MGLLRILAPIALIVGLYWLVKRSVGGPTEPSCATCRHCRKAFDDGTLCGFGAKEVFKKPVHVKNCTDYSPR